MSTIMKIKLSRIGIVVAASILCLTSFAGATFAQSLPDLKGTAETVAAMNVIELFAYIALTSTGLTFVMVGIYVKTVSTSQKDAAAWMATISAQQESISSALHDVAQTCNNKRCPGIPK